MAMILTTTDQSRAERSYGAVEKARGAIFTKPAVVDFMLDAAGYSETQPLHTFRILEPSFGSGSFVLAVVKRLTAAWRAHGGKTLDELSDALRAVELDTETFEAFSAKLRGVLENDGFSREESAELVGAWLVHDDFLLHDFGDQGFDFVIGNPPYVRQELVESSLLAEYRSRFITMIGRADLYVAFIERSLDLLNPAGRLSFICADAWVKNEYGRALRQKIVKDFWLRNYVDMYGLDSFEVPVGAYPSITVIENSPSGHLREVRAMSVDTTYLTRLGRALLQEGPHDEESGIRDIPMMGNGTDPWLFNGGLKTTVIRKLEAQFPTLQQAGCRVGIGVATGNDKAYIAPFDELDVEDDRKLPLATNRDVPGGNLIWSGKGIVNPWTDDGKLVDLDKYPRMAAHLGKNRGDLEKRHTARKGGTGRWIRTIDRITPSLAQEPKLFIPDIKGNGDAIAFDPGTLYPHHNLYFITSTEWNLRALQALLRSGVAVLFVEAYSVKIGGGFLRFQAQNLKRICVPFWNEVDSSDQEEMVRCGEAGEKLHVSLLERLYKLEPGELAFLGD
jgi:hypothetical protein